MPKPHELNPAPATLTAGLAQVMLDVVLHVPRSREQTADIPAQRAKAISKIAARNASMTAGSMALPPGALGWLTVIPELVAVWKIQAQMVADIAAAYGQSATLGKEQMLYCLFKQAAAQLARDMLVRVGERLVLQQLSSKALQAISKKIGVQLTQTLLKKGASRWIPVLGAMGVGAYAYADTLQVAKNAVALFEGDTRPDAKMQ